MTNLSRNKFLQGLPTAVTDHLPPDLQTLQVRRPWQWLVQFHYGEPRLHYEIAPVARREAWELGFHCEAKDSNLNKFLLKGFRQHLFEIKDVLGDRIEAEMWDRGWSKIYETIPAEPLTTAYQTQIGRRLAEIIICVHPIYVELRDRVSEVYR